MSTWIVEGGFVWLLEEHPGRPSKRYKSRSAFMAVPTHRGWQKRVFGSSAEECREACAEQAKTRSASERGWGTKTKDADAEKRREIELGLRPGYRRPRL